MYVYLDYIIRQIKGLLLLLILGLVLSTRMPHFLHYILKLYYMFTLPFLEPLFNVRLSYF
jgi:hypothetical protein